MRSFVLLLIASMGITGIVLVLTGSTHSVSNRMSTEPTMPKHTVFVYEYASMDGKSGELAITPDGRRWFRVTTSTTFEEIKP